MAKVAGEGKGEYGMGAVCRLTGLTDHTIRVWERRYGVVVAERAANGRRVYNRADVEKLALLKALTDRGLSIGQIASDSVDELRERADAMDEFRAAPLPDIIGIAVLGDTLPHAMATYSRGIAPVEVRVADDNRGRFVTDLRNQSVDVVVVESPMLDDALTAQLAEYMALGGAAHGVIVYKFGRDRDVELARHARTIVLRAPANVDEVRAAILRAYTPTAPENRAGPDTDDSNDASWSISGPVAPRRFSTVQLGVLTRASTSIDCECPHHLAQLVGDLTAFEIYSASCANRDEEDAALHRYLHHTTARARALIEEALERVAAAEGIEY
ncbi:MAG: MerR family transcriptional regulator [Woeseiaceae bacterium]|nr:MerR family transcriptional regulator [Woeseiaceae bacterium]